MKLRSIRITDFRNLASVEVEPGPRFNVLSGDNGQGKTSFLEAVYVAATLRSFRAAKNAELVRVGAARARVLAEVSREAIDHVHEVTLAEGRREARLDGKVPRPLAAYFGGFNVVLFAPEDLHVPRGSPGARRRFLDRAVFNRDVGFLDLAQRYQRVLKSRNQVLKQDRPDRALLEVYGVQLAELGAKLVAARRRYLGELEPYFAEALAGILRQGLEASFVYDTEEDLAAALARSLPKDLARRQTSVGPHVDDLDFRLGGRTARTFASQGQLRALVLAWKIAEVRLLRDRLGDPPLLLLDDVSSELDPQRTAHLFEFLAQTEGQCFVTTTHPSYVRLGGERIDYTVAAGAVSR